MEEWTKREKVLAVFLVGICLISLGSYLGYAVAASTRIVTPDTIVLQEDLDAALSNATKTQELPFSNITSVPGIGSYNYLIGSYGNGTYYASLPNGTVKWTSSDYVTVAQNAVNSLTNGGKIITSTGDFEYTTELIINQTKIDFEGLGDSTRFYTDGMAKSFIHIKPVTQNLEGITLSKFKIDGTHQTADTHAGAETTINGHGIVIDLNGTSYTALYPVISQVTVYNAYNEAICEYGTTSADFDQFTYGTVDKCVVISTNSTTPSYRGIHPHGEHSWSITENTLIGGFSDAGIRHGTTIAFNRLLNFTGSYGIVGSQTGYTINGNHFDNCSGSFGITAWDTAGEIELITGNSFNSCPFTYACIAVGLQHLAHQGVTVTNNMGTDIHRNFIQILNTTSHCLVQGNQLQRVGKGTDNFYTGIYVASTASFIDVKDNKINWYGTGNELKYGIEVLGSNCTVTGNEISTGDTAAIYNSGTSNSFGDNKLTTVTTFVEAGTLTHYLTLHDALAGLTATTEGWDTVPSDLAYATDSDITTVTGVGTKTTSGSGEIGALVWNIGAARDIQSLTFKIGCNSSTSSVTAIWYDNATGSQLSGVNVVSSTSTTTVVKYGLDQAFYGQYPMLRFNAGAAATADVKIYDVKAWYLGW